MPPPDLSSMRGWYADSDGHYYYVAPAVDYDTLRSWFVIMRYSGAQPDGLFIQRAEKFLLRAARSQLRHLPEPPFGTMPPPSLDQKIDKTA